MSEVAQPATRREVLVVLPGLMLAVMLGMLDHLILGTAMPTIVGELGGLEHLSWVVTAYILTSTVSTPIYGKLGDLYGRKRLFLGAIVIFLIGSALSGLSQTMAQLIAFRAIQGLGAGGLFVGAIAIIGDLVSPRERGRYQGYIAALMALAMVGGPLVGGLITDHLSWRWAFYVNLPLGALALLLVALTMHLPRHVVKHRIDYLGTGLLAAGTTALVLLTTWGGTEYRWASPQIIGLAVGAVVCLVLFVVVESRASEPVLPLRLFRNRNFSVTSAIGFLQGFAMFGAITFLPLYQQTVQGASATNSGLLLMPLLGGMLVASLVAGQSVTRTGRYKVFPIVGTGLTVVGMALLSLLDVGTSKLTSGFYMAVLGVGMGLLMQIMVVIAQNSVHPRDMGVASSSTMFFRQIGGSFGVALFGAIFVNELRHELAGRLPAGTAVSGGRFDPASVAQLPEPTREAFLTGVAHGMQAVFGWSVLVTLIAFAIAWFIREVPLRGGAPGPHAPSERAKEPAPIG